MIFTARDTFGQLAGYAACFDYDEHSHMCRKFLQVDLVYVRPDYRDPKYGAADGLMNIIDAYAEWAGAEFIYFGMPEKVYEHSMKHRGFEKVEVGTVKKVKRNV